MVRRLVLAASLAVLTISWAVPEARAQMAASAAAAAPSEAKLARAQELFAVMHMDQTYSQMTTQLMASVNASESQMLSQNTQTPTQETEQAAFQTKLMGLVMSELSWEKLEPDFAKLYAGAYTDEQLDGLIAFYRSPLGQTVLARTPELLRQSNTVSQQHLSVIMPQLRQMLQDEAAKLHGTTGKPADPSQYK